VVQKYIPIQLDRLLAQFNATATPTAQKNAWTLRARRFLFWQVRGWA